MKRWSVILAAALLLMSTVVDAKRLAGGTSVGKQSSNVTQRYAAPASPTAPAATPNVAPAANPSVAKPAPAAPTPAAPAPKRPWGAMLGGLAAGLGLAWLASTLGLGAGFANVLLVLLVVLVAVALLGAWRRSRAAAASPYAFQTAAPVPAGGAVPPRDYSPKNVGNDASARPWEHTGFDAGGGAGGAALIGSALAGPQGWGVPADFDAQGFLQASKNNFVKLQDAWDRGDVPALRAMMTDDMIEQIQAQLSAREAHAGGQVNQTEVVVLEAQLLGIEELPQEYMASVEFSGMIREEAAAGPNPFREVWNITRPKSGQGGWLVAGVQALQ